MHKDEIEQEHNLYDDEHPEWYVYDPEITNAWFWEKFIESEFPS